MSLSPWNPNPAPQPLSLVSRILGQQAAAPVALPVTSRPSTGFDRLTLATPASLFQSVMPTVSTSFAAPGESPAQQLQRLGRKYGVTLKADLNKAQSDVIKAIIRHKAAEYGIPEHVALGIGGNESGWKMWKNVASGELVAGRNVRDGVLKSTDWGAMQINDKAHPKAFPRVKQDLEYNIDYAMRYLARQRQSIQGDLGHGLGDWDRTVASYNLGHNPKTTRGYEIASRYVGHVAKRADQFA
ncbi:MAG: hypothetical protein CVV27_02820 [Candidatus Melainabacteria bacterium HGW-Melainabacteria-1]|nr:MAG: hypothetical protein CVV27_02820 [Candidatus Melainabacteria bacterium HGW-Melainabacteria-1]